MHGERKIKPYCSNLEISDKHFFIARSGSKRVYDETPLQYVAIKHCLVYKGVFAQVSTWRGWQIMLKWFVFRYEHIFGVHIGTSFDAI